MTRHESARSLLAQADVVYVPGGSSANLAGRAYARDTGGRRRRGGPSGRRRPAPPRSGRAGAGARRIGPRGIDEPLESLALAS